VAMGRVLAAFATHPAVEYAWRANRRVRDVHVYNTAGCHDTKSQLSKLVFKELKSHFRPEKSQGQLWKNMVGLFGKESKSNSTGRCTPLVLNCFEL